MTSILSSIVEFAQSRPLPGLVWGLHYDGQGNVRELAQGEAPAMINEGWYWFHFGLADNRTHMLLSKLSNDAAARFVEIGEETQQIIFSGETTYGTIADMQRGLDGSRDHSGYMHFIAANNVLITVRRNALYGAGATRQLVLRGTAIASVEALLENIIFQIIDGFDRTIEQVAEDVDRLEDRVIAGIVNDARARLGASRRTVVRIHRHLSSLRTMLLRLNRDSNSPAPASFLALAQHVCQYSDQLEHEIASLRERSRLLHDEIATMLAEETNRHLQVLSILTILFIPPSFIAGLFGMNLKGMLFDNSEHGFLIACLLTVAASAIVAWLLKRSGIMGRRDYR
ncbi:MAG: CorA family divalent cation transporter [Hyphomicrobiaceae bacterium]